MREWVELGPTGLVIRIFRSKKAAVLYQICPSHGIQEPIITQMDRDKAVGEIRKQVFERDDYRCVICGSAVQWKRGLPNSGEMDERQARGTCVEQSDGTYKSGEVSVENCQTLCHECHQGSEGKHQRQPQWSSGPGL